MNRLLTIFLLTIAGNNLFADFIQYSGVSYIAQNSSVEDAYPNSLKIEKHLRKIIFNHLSENIPQDSSLKLSVSESFEEDPLSLIISIDNENLSSIQLNNNCLRTYSIGLQVITYNLKSQQILSIKPFAIRKIYLDPLIKNSCKENNEKENLLRFSEIYFGLDISKSDYKEYISLDDDSLIMKAKSTSLKNNSYMTKSSFLLPVLEDVLSSNYFDSRRQSFFVGVEDIVLSSFSKDQMSGQKELKKNHLFLNSNDYNFDDRQFKVWVGQQFSKWFSETFDYPIIPFVKGKSLGRDIAIKFADQDKILNLKLPKLDFGFIIKLKGFKKVKLDESNLREAYAWAAFADIEFHNVGIQKMTQIELKNVFTDEVNKGDSVDDWNNFNLSLNRILKDYVSNLNNADKKWILKSSKMSTKDFKKHSNLIKTNIKLDNVKK
tara:strand:- start:2741 stop:4042 length:1302 start_codon:yes stop_codon:yes gene_type:complete